MYPLGEGRLPSGYPPIVPSIDVLETTQDRAREKTFLAAHDLPHVHFAVVRSEQELREAARTFGWPFILKTVRGGYDGNGQFYVAGHEDLDAAILALHQRGPTFDGVLEEVVDLELEASCIGARSEKRLDLSARKHHPDVVDVVLYGKRDAKPRRKMGHFVTHAESADRAIASARSFRDALGRT